MPGAECGTEAGKSGLTLSENHCLLERTMLRNAPGRMRPRNHDHDPGVVQAFST